jgi:hypothetical protein
MRFNLLTWWLGVSLLLSACAAKDTALFRDDFSNAESGWVKYETQNSSAQYAGGEFVFKISKDNWFVWSNPAQTNLTHIRLEATARNINKVDDVAFGLICNYQDAKHFNYAAIDGRGFYVIGRFDGKDTFLTNNNKWARSEAIPELAEKYRFGFDCAKDGMLTFYVDGKPVATTKDSTWVQGDVGLLVWTQKAKNAEVHFDDFVVTALKE